MIQLSCWTQSVKLLVHFERHKPSSRENTNLYFTFCCNEQICKKFWWTWSSVYSWRKVTSKWCTSNFTMRELTFVTVAFIQSHKTKVANEQCAWLIYLRIFSRKTFFFQKKSREYRTAGNSSFSETKNLKCTPLRSESWTISWNALVYWVSCN